MQKPEKELSLCNKLCFLKSFYIFRFQCRRSQIFQTINSVRSNNVSLKYQSFATLGLKRYKDFKFRVCGKDSIPLFDCLQVCNIPEQTMSSNRPGRTMNQRAMYLLEIVLQGQLVNIETQNSMTGSTYTINHCCQTIISMHYENHSLIITTTGTILRL